MKNNLTNVANIIIVNGNDLKEPELVISKHGVMRTSEMLFKDIKHTLPLKLSLDYTSLYCKELEVSLHIITSFVFNCVHLNKYALKDKTS